MQQAVTPKSTFRFECKLAKLLWELGRLLVQRTFNLLEPDNADAMPGRIRIGLAEYRRNRKRQRNVWCLFGQITLRRYIYQSVEPGEPGVFPLQIALGIVGHQATAALADVVGRLAAELTQQQTLAVLRERYGVSWSVGTLRKVVAELANIFGPLRHENQVNHVAEMLRKAFKSRGKCRPSLVVGRDGVMVQTRPCWEEAATATVTVYDRRGKRLGTVYLGRMPELGQATMTEQLTHLITDVLDAWDGPLPRLHYVTDAGHHPQEFFRRVLRPMKHPRTGKRLEWTWSVDYFHAAERITTIAESIFGAGRAAQAWAERMRRVLKDSPSGSSRVVQSAGALRRSRGLQGSRKDFDKAVSYLKRYRPHMDYTGYRRVQLPIGSGVTEAACKTIFGYRFKQSGMRWNCETGQQGLDLRVILKSNIWTRLRTSWLQAIVACEPVDSVPSTDKKQRLPRVFALPT